MVSWEYVRTSKGGFGLVCGVSYCPWGWRVTMGQEAEGRVGARAVRWGEHRLYVKAERKPVGLEQKEQRGATEMCLQSCRARHALRWGWGKHRYAGRLCTNVCLCFPHQEHKVFFNTPLPPKKSCLPPWVWHCPTENVCSRFPAISGHHYPVLLILNKFLS